MYVVIVRKNIYQGYSVLSKFGLICHRYFKYIYKAFLRRYMVKKDIKVDK